MPGRTLDAIIMETLGVKEMTIQRLLWQIEDLKATIDELQPKDAHESQRTPERDHS